MSSSTASRPAARIISTARTATGPDPGSAASAAAATPARSAGSTSPLAASPSAAYPSTEASLP